MISSAIMDIGQERKLLLSERITGDVCKLAAHHQLLSLIENYEKKKCQGIISQLVTDFNHSRLFENKIQPRPIVKYQIIALGGYGIIFATRDLCFKVSISDTEENHDYTKPLSLANIPNKIEDMIMIPLASIRIIPKGLYHYLHIQYVIIYLISKLFQKDFTPITRTQLGKMVKGYRDIVPEIPRSTLAEMYRFLLAKYLPDNPQLDLEHIYWKIASMCKFFKRMEKKNKFAFCTLYNRAHTSLYRLTLNSNLDFGPKYDAINTLQLRKKNHPFYLLRLAYITVAIFLLKANQYVAFKHRDLKPDNILIERCGKYTLSYDDYENKNNNITFDFDYKFRLKINDFGLAVYPSMIHKDYVWFNDMHFFTHFLFLYYENAMYLDREFADFLFTTYIEPYCCKNPQELINDNFATSTCQHFALIDPPKLHKNELIKTLRLPLFDIYQPTQTK